MSKVSGSFTHWLELRDTGREEAGWGPKMRIRTFKPKKRRGVTRILRRADGMGICGQPKGSIGWTAREENVSLRGSIMWRGGRVEPSSYVKDSKLQWVGERGGGVANLESGLVLMVDGRCRWFQIQRRSEQDPNTCDHSDLQTGEFLEKKKVSHSTFLVLIAFPDFAKGMRNERGGQAGILETTGAGPRGRRGVNRNDRCEHLTQLSTLILMILTAPNDQSSFRNLPSVSSVAGVLRCDVIQKEQKN